MKSFFNKPPLNVFRKTVGPCTTYAEAALWLNSDDPIAVSALSAVRDNNCVLFVQLGGFSEVMCCAPCAAAPEGVCFRTARTSKPRGEQGKAVLFVYQ